MSGEGGREGVRSRESRRDMVAAVGWFVLEQLESELASDSYNQYCTVLNLEPRTKAQ